MGGAPRAGEAADAVSREVRREDVGVLWPDGEARRGEAMVAIELDDVLLAKLMDYSCR